MRELILVDFKRVLKDKLLIVLGILAVVFAAITPLLFSAITSGNEALDNPMLSMNFYAKDLFFNCFSMGSNLGLIAPVLLSIIICKDFSFGTVRNKIIAGKRRSEIFLSMFIVSAVILIAVMLLNAFLTLGLGLLIFDYQASPFELSDFWYFLESLGFELLILLFIAAMISWLSASMKNVGLVIVLYVAISFALVMVASIINVILQFMGMAGGGDDLYYFLEFLSRINVANNSVYIGTGFKYSASDVAYQLIPPLVGILGFLGLGLIKFNKKDLK